MSPHRAFGALRNRDYRLFFVGQLVSMAGTWMQAVVQSWMVYRLTHSASWLGIISFCTQFPAFLISPIAGTLADRVDRRKLLIATQTVAMIQAAVLGILVYLGKETPARIAVLSVLLGFCNAFEITTRHAFAADVVGKEDLHSALSLNSIGVNGSRVLGPGLAALILSKVGEAGCFFVNAVSFLGVIIGLAMMRSTQRVLPSSPGLQGLTRGFLQAIRVVRKDREILHWMGAAFFISLLGFPFLNLLPVFARDILRGNAETLAGLTAMAGLGAISSALVAGVRPNRRSSHARDLAPSAFCMAAAFALLAGSSQGGVSKLAVFIIGYFLMGAFPRINHGIQTHVEDAFRGRVLSLYTMTFLGSVPLGSLLSGWSCDRWGVRAVVYAGAGLYALFGLVLLQLQSRPQRG